jgi:hypothetical protein
MRFEKKNEVIEKFMSDNLFRKSGKGLLAIVIVKKTHFEIFLLGFHKCIVYKHNQYTKLFCCNKI